MGKSGRQRVIRIRTSIIVPDYKSLLLYFWFFNIITLTVARFLLHRIGLDEGTVRTVVIWFVASIPLILYLLEIRNIGFANVKPFVILFLSVAFAWSISAIANPVLWEFLTRENYGPDRFFQPDAALFAFLFFLMFDDPKQLLKNVTGYAYIFFLYEMVFGLIPAMRRGYWINVSPTGEELLASYSLSFGYSMCFPTVVFLYRSIKEKRIIHIFMTIACLLCILTNGNRGALLIPVILIAMMLISKIVEERNGVKKTFQILLVFAGAAAVYFLGKYLLQIIAPLSERLGFSSRNIEMLIEGKIADDNGRQVIWNAVIEAIKTGGSFGYGVYGDRPFVSPIHYVGYSHNLFLELLVSFGIIGVLLIAMIVRDGIQMVFFCKDTDWRELYIIFFSISCQLLLSLSFWYVWEFWAAAAIAYKYRQIRRSARMIPKIA